MRRPQTPWIDRACDEMLKRMVAESERSEVVSLPAADGDDPTTAFVGIIADDDGPDDLASELDHYAYGVPKGPKHQEASVGPIQAEQRG